MLLALLLACTEDDTTLSAGTDTDDGADDDDELLDATPLAAEVSETELAATIADLEAFGTRYTATQGNADARDYLATRLEDLGLVAEVVPFEWRGGISANVIARKDGASDAVWIFSAHYDSTSQSAESSAPGADDNASAVAAVLEAARILGPHRLRDDVWFVLTGAEEQGSKGSAALVGELEADGTDVRGVLAPDMIGYWPLGDDDAFDILGDEDSEALATSLEEVADTLGVASKVWIEHDYCYGDDHTNFQDAGFPALSPMDCVEAHNGLSDETTPHYHRTSDTSDTLHLPFTARVTGVLVAGLAGWAGVLE